MGISVDLQAKTGPASKELEQFGKKLTGLAKLWEGAFGGRGQRQAGQNLQQLSKGVEALAKQADSANQRLKAINQTMEQVVKTRMKLVDAQGRVAGKDRDQYESLLGQEKALAAQQKSWQNIAAIRGQMAQNGGLTAGPNGTFGGGAGTGQLNRFGGPLKEFSGQLKVAVGAFAGVALGVGIKAFHEALDEQKGMADFVPRFLRPGGREGTNTYKLGDRFRSVGAPLGYRGDETLRIMEAMSAGGSGVGKGLERDSRTAMQFGRLFGIDAGGEASMLSTAQRTGAFKAGDAKRFAGMLAEQIARTGLGPRAQEVQEATLMLLNQQVHQLGTANPGPIMALQTMFNKTGIPGLTGMAGASTISRMQDAVTNPGSEASEALNFAVFRKMGAKSLYDVKSLQEEGLSNPMYLPALFRMVESSAPNPEAADLALKEHLGGALSLHNLKDIRARNHGRLSGFSGNLAEIEKWSGKGSGVLEKGAAAAMGLPGNQFRVVEASLHDALVRGGNTLLPKASEIAKDVASGLGKLRSIADSGATTAQRTSQLADMFSRWSGLQPGSPGDKAVHGAAGMAAGIAGEIAKTQQFEKAHPGQKRRIPQIAQEMIDSRLQSHFGKGFDNENRGFRSEPGGKWHVDQYLPDGTRRHGPKGSATNPAPSLPGGDTKHLTVTIKEDGIVADKSKRQVRAWLHDVIDERHHGSLRGNPNTRNHR